MTKYSTPPATETVVGPIVINVMTIISVDQIIARYNILSMNPSKPTPIGHDFIWMTSDDPRGWSTNGDPANISLNARARDWLSFWGSSITDNSDTAAFIIRVTGGMPILSPSRVDITTLERAAYPTPPTAYPFNSEPNSYSSCDAKVTQKGTAKNFWVVAALFSLGDDGNTQHLAGYVKWDPTVIVK